MSENPTLEFQGGRAVALLTIAIFLVFGMLYFVVFDAFDLAALAAGAFVALLLTSFLARSYEDYWQSVRSGMGNPTAITIVLILFLVAMFAQLMSVTKVSDGFVWLADNIGMSGGTFVLFVFVAVCTLSMATGSSIGSMFTVFPIFYPAAEAVGADPAFVAGAIISGGIFGDNLAPVSDTTILSASTQRFRRREGAADIGGVVVSRSKYALTAALISGALFFVLGSLFSGDAAADRITAAAPDPTGLVMLVPVGIMLAVAFFTRDIYKAIAAGLVIGTATALAFGLIEPDGIVGASEGVPTGFLVEGVTEMMGTVTLVVAVFGIMGVLRDAGILQYVIDRVSSSRLAGTPRGAELSIGVGATATNLLFGGVGSAALVTFGPIADDIGARVGLHPYRRSNVMDCFIMGLSCVVPVLSAFLFIGSSLTKGQEPSPELSVFSLFGTTLYPLVLTGVMLFAVLTGWGRRFEGADGEPVKALQRAEEKGQQS